MRKLTSLTSIIFASALIVGCSGSKKNEFEGIPAQELYNKGQTFLQDNDYNSAIRYLDAIDVHAQGGAYAEQIQLSLIYAQYKLGEYRKALDIAERFARSYPASNQMDYVFYLAALSNARLADNWVQDFFGLNPSGRAEENVRNAYGNFQTIVEQYPHSQYASQAQQWLSYLKNRLAENELTIAKFYMKRKAYIAVANRVQEMLRIYPESKATYEALPLLQQAFESMGIKDSARKVEAMIEKDRNKTFADIEKPEYPKQF